MPNCLKQFVLFSGLALSGAVLAQSASERLSRIEAETMVLKAREKQLDVQAKIIAKQSEIASRRADSERLAHAAVAGNPLVLSIEGVGPAMYATLQMENGNTADVQVGDVLPNGMKVVSIRPNEVIIESGKKRRTRLASGSQAAPSFDPSYPSAGLRLPPLAPPVPAAMPRGPGK